MALPLECKVDFDDSKFIRAVEFDTKSIETLVTTKTSEIDEWIRDIYTILNGNGAVVGLCIQSKPRANKDNASKKAATLQLCVDDKCLIVQLFHMGSIPESLKSFLLDTCFTFVGLGIDPDVFHKLAEEYGLVCGRFDRLSDLAQKVKPVLHGRRPPLLDLTHDAGLYSFKSIPMEIFMSNWEARFLNSDQIKYGCIYAYAVCKIGLFLLKNTWKEPFIVLTKSLRNFEDFNGLYEC